MISRWIFLDKGKFHELGPSAYEYASKKGTNSCVMYQTPFRSIHNELQNPLSLVSIIPGKNSQLYVCEI
jgi:hypothetical protein